MRHSFLSFVIAAAPLAAVACAASGSDTQQHGPVFDLADAGPTPDGTTVPPGDAGPGSVDADHGTDATQAAEAAAPAEAGADASPVADASKDAAKDALLESAAPDASDGSTSSCTGRVALAAGNGTTLYQAVFPGAGPWTSTTTNAPVLSVPAIVATGAGEFHTVLRTTGDVLKYDTSTGTAWSALANVSVTPATSPEGPALVSTGASLHLVYRGNNDKFYHGTFSANSWDAANDPVGGAGALQSFGPSAPAAAAVGTSVVIAQDGSNNVLYDQSLVGGSWQAAHAQAGAMVGTVRPAITAMIGGTSDLMVAFNHQTDNKISFSTRTGTTWSAPAVLDVNTFSTDRVTLAALSGGRAVLIFRGTDSKPYFSTYDTSQAPVWTVAAPLVAGTNPAISGVPAVTTGVCGDDAVAAFPLTSGDVQVVRLRGATWTAPEAVTGSSGATSVSIAATP